VKPWFQSAVGMLGALWLHAQVAGAAQGPDKPAAIEESVDTQRGSLAWSYRGRTLLTYAFGTNLFKPYVRELSTLDGQNILRDAPPDHPHHHGLMYALRVNGVNYWEESGHPGQQHHARWIDHGTGHARDGLPQARFTELLLWVPEAGTTGTGKRRDAVLVERRTLVLTVDEAGREVALAWHAEFEPGPRTNRVHLDGADYNGLGFRLPAAWDLAARHGNSDDAPYPTHGVRDVFPARWASVAQPGPGQGAQIVLCDLPRKHAGSPRFFAMTRPFAYLSVTQGVDRTPLDYRSGDRFELDYLVLVYPAARTKAQIEARYQRWATAFH